MGRGIARPGEAFSPVAGLPAVAGKLLFIVKRSPAVAGKLLVNVKR
jgi:hypothetical protein